MKNKSPFFILLTVALLASSCGLNPSSSSTSVAMTSESSSSISESSSSAVSSSTPEPSSSSSSTTVSSSSSHEYSSAPVPTIETDSRWPVDFKKRGQAFMDDLGTMIRSSGSLASSYNSCLSIGAKAAAYPNANSSTFIPLYRAPSAENKTTTNSCNREHTWPDSRGGNKFETDPVMVRPTLRSDNSDRQNYFYGLGGASAREWDPASFGYEDARGQCARIILYCVTAYHASGVALSNNPGDATNLSTMGTLRTLLEWNRVYAPSEFEITVNDRYDSMGYRRNPFVDHPGYADYIYDNDGLRTTDETIWHDQVTDVDSLDGKQLAIVSQDPKKTGYFMMGDKAKGASIPWYINCTQVRYQDGRFTSDVDPIYFTFAKNAEGKFTITNAAGERLFGYVNGSYYSIGFGKNASAISSQASGATSISDLWEITSTSSGMDIKSSVYLECYNGSYCGYQYAPRLKPMLFA